MLRERLGRHVDRLRGALREALLTEHSPRQIAGSFAVGTFVTMLPTLGAGLVLFVVLVRLVDRINDVALFASVLVFNPAVKWGVYVLSLALGVLLLGPVEAVDPTEVSVETGEALLLRLLAGNLILAVVATVVAYVVAHRLALRYEESAVGEIVDDALHDIAEVVVED